MCCKIFKGASQCNSQKLNYLICVKHQSRTWCSTTGRSTVLVKCSNCCIVSTGEWDTCDQADLCQVKSVHTGSIRHKYNDMVRKRQNKRRDKHQPGHEVSSRKPPNQQKLLTGDRGFHTGKQGLTHNSIN